MSFYAQVFGANDLQLDNSSEMPADQRPPGAVGSVMHAQFSSGPGAPLMGCDIPPVMGSPVPGSHSVIHGAPDVATDTRVFAALSDRGNVEIAIAATFWSAAFGMVKDKFGTHWMISAPQAV